MLVVPDRKRRSHLRRTASTRGVQVTDRDVLDIFAPLARHAHLSTRQLVAYGRRHPVVTKGRLGDLWHATEGLTTHWLHRLVEDAPFVNHLNVDDMHRLGADAEAVLVARGLIAPDGWVAASRIGGTGTGASRIVRLAHDHMASQIVLDIELGARAAGIAFHDHLDILNAAPADTRRLGRPLRIPVNLDGRPTHVEPDALFAVAGRTYALEADMGTESIRAVITAKIRAYREIVAAGVIDRHLGVDRLTVLFVTPSEARAAAIMRELGSIAPNGRSTMFAFRSEPDCAAFARTPPPSGRLLTEPWARLGHDDLVLSGA